MVVQRHFPRKGRGLDEYRFKGLYRFKTRVKQRRPVAKMGNATNFQNHGGRKESLFFAAAATGTDLHLDKVNGNVFPLK